MSRSNHESRRSEDSNWRGRASSVAGTVLNASAPAFAPPNSPARALGALLASGPTRIDITAERKDATASPDRPLFLNGLRYDPAEIRMWYEEVLPYLSKCTFIISSTTDVTYCGDIFASAALPHILSAVTRLELPKFYWFSGVALNRHHNPYMQMCSNLPNLRQLSLTFHTAGLTSQRWPERQIIALEEKNPEAAKERMLLSLREVVHRYELDAIFTFRGLRLLYISYIESEMTAFFCKVGNPLDVMGELKAYLEKGFLQRSMQVAVELMRVEGETLA